MNRFRRPATSERAPDHSFSTLAVVSARPSIRPSCAFVPRNTVIRNVGSSGKIASLAMSFSRLIQPSRTTCRGSREGFGLSTCEVRFRATVQIGERRGYTSYAVLCTQYLRGLFHVCGPHAPPYPVVRAARFVERSPSDRIAT